MSERLRRGRPQGADGWPIGVILACGCGEEFRLVAEDTAGVDYWILAPLETFSGYRFPAQVQAPCPNCGKITGQRKGE